jgi:hypothetical protein
MRTRRRFASIALLAVALPVLAATPPPLIDYHGVLRDASGNPLTGTYDMIFRFFSAPSGGSAVFEDGHFAAFTGGVVVTDGLFNVALGSGEPAGPSVSLAQVFQNLSTVYMEIQVGTETFPQRIRIVSAAYALNSTHLNGKADSAFAQLGTSNTFSTGGQKIQTGAAATKGLIVQGSSGQSANLQEWQGSSGTVVASVGSSGIFSGNGSGLTNITADQLSGHPSGFFIDTSSASQTKSGQLTADASLVSNSTGVRGFGMSVGGFFADSNNTGQSFVGYGDYGIRAFGSYPGGMAGYFKDSAYTGESWLADGDTGVIGYGAYAGGIFRQGTSSSYTTETRIASGSFGIDASGTTGGGHFKDANASGEAWVGYGHSGIEGAGDNYGGIFRDSNNSGTAFVGYGDFGIDAKGNAAGGHFVDLDGSGYAFVANGDLGIAAYGDVAGAFFQSSDATGRATVGAPSLGIDARGASAGGYFYDIDSTGQAWIAEGDRGVFASGFEYGGRFQDAGQGSQAYVGYQNVGIWGEGNGPAAAGGLFSVMGSSTYTYVSEPGYKVRGTGVVSFVQNHPYEKDRVVVYAAPEGDEVAVYTRGSARLHNGEARVKLGDTFALVTNPDVGLTAQVTPIGEPVALAVLEKGTSEILVRGPVGANTEFDYIVWGLRIGFERAAVVQPKQRESFLLTDEELLAQYGGHAELEAKSALARFEAMDAGAPRGRAADRSRSQALASAINEGRGAYLAAQREAESAREKALPKRPAADELPEAAVHPAVSVADASKRTVATPIRSSESIELVPAIGTIEPGDVLVLDPTVDGAVRSSSTAEDLLVVGCAAVLEDASVAAPAAGQVALATGRIVRCRGDAQFGPIAVGDYLVTSPVPGHAMRAGDVKSGAILGKAAEPLESGTGLVRVVVTLH